MELRRRCIPLLLAAVLTGCVAPMATTPDRIAATSTDLPPADAARLRDRARQIHARVLTIDTHVDIPFEFATDSIDPGVRGPYKVDLPKMVAGGLDAAFWIVYVAQPPQRDAAAYAAAKERALTKFAAIHRMARRYPDTVELAATAADVPRIHAAGKVVGVIGVENGFVIGDDLSLLARYHELGARYITLSHGGHNDICDSSTPRDWDEGPELHGGVSPFGAQVIAEMNRLGIMVDVSHVSKASMLDAVRLSRAPVIASHSSVRALADHPRNLDDEELLALRDHGGVLQTVALGAYLRVDPPERNAARRALDESFGLGAERRLEDLDSAQRQAFDARLAVIDTAWPRASVRDLVDHIDYAVALMGIDHVGISSDFDGGGGIEGWQDAAETLNVTTELVRRGYTEEEIGKLWGGNLLRVWRAAERVATELQGGQ